MQCTTRNNLQMLDSEDIALVASIANNMEIIDAALAKCNFAGTREPGPGDDSDDGYSAGSKWFYGNKIFRCFSAAAGAAVWLQTYGAGADIDANTLDGYSSSYFAPATKGVTNGDLHDHADGDGAQIAYSSLGGIPSTFTPSGHHGSHESGGSDAVKLDDLAAPDDNTDLNVSSTKHGLCPKAPNDTSKFFRGDGSWAIMEGASFWMSVPGSPARVSDTQFTITDAGNANSYDKVFKKRRILKWTESGNFKTAMVISSAYADNVVTINIVGDALGASFANLKYFLLPAEKIEFLLPWRLAVGTDVSRTHFVPEALYKLSVDTHLKTAGTTNANVFDVNDDGTSIITTKPSIGSGETSDIDNVCDSPSTVIAAGSLLTVDVDATCTTPGQDAYLILYAYPEAWRYIA